MLATMQAWFKGGPTGETPGEGSLLDDWNNYANSQQRTTSVGIDLESAVPESFAPLLKTANETVKGAFNSVTNRVRELPGNVSSVTTSMPSTKQIMYFGLFMAVGVFFIFLAFGLFLPVMALMPQKFAITFTLGCLFIMGSFFALKGPKTQFLHMVSIERLPFTCVFLASMFATIFVSMYLHSYPLSLLFSIIQVLSMLYYVLSYFPGGTSGMKFIGSFVTGSVTKLFRGSEEKADVWCRSVSSRNGSVASTVSAGLSGSSALPFYSLIILLEGKFPMLHMLGSLHTNTKDLRPHVEVDL